MKVPHFFRRPVYALHFVKNLDLYADDQQLNDFIDGVTKKLDDVIRNGFQEHIAPLPIEKQKELQRQELNNIHHSFVVDTHSSIKANFLYSKPLFKDVPPYNYFKYEVSEQDIQNCSKELFNNYDLRIVCTTPYGFTDAGIKAKLEAFLTGK